MRIAFFEIQGWEKNHLTKALKGQSLKFYKEPLTLENVKEAADCQVISIFVGCKITKEILEKLPKLKMINTGSTGFDHIDLKECQKRNIRVSNVPFYGENTVAEHTFGLMLALSRNIHKAYLRTTRENYTIEGLRGFDLKGKTIGVVGAGSIGLNVIKIASGFGMKILAFDTRQNNFLAEVLGFEYASLENLLKKSDIITLHVPYNKFTHHLINKDNVGLIKKGALLINTSRGGVVDTQALIEALDKKILSGAGLDVLEGEELIKEEQQLLYEPQKMDVLGQLVKDHILLSKENVVFTPHIAFYSQEALDRILETTSENIKEFIAGCPQNICGL